jgi:hypothetical protein
MNTTPTPRTDSEIEDARNVALEFTCKNPPPKRGDNVYVVSADFARQLERELNEAQDWVKASMESASIASATIARLESERDQLREWVAREIQQMPDMGGGVPFAWEKLDEQSRSMWRMRADEAASRLAAQGLERETK